VEKEVEPPDMPAKAQSATAAAHGDKLEFEMEGIFHNEGKQ
jgi:hypothetical protein